MRRLAPYLLLILAIIIFDQYTKYLIASSFSIGESIPVIEGFFNLTYVKNTGAAFGFAGSFDTWPRYALILILPVVACIWISVLLFKSLEKKRLLPLAYTFILGGALGNLIDRFRLDYVVDFLHFYWKDKHFEVFNIADSAISIAAGLLILDFILERKQMKILESQN